MKVIAKMKDGTTRDVKILNATTMIDAIVEAKDKFTDEQLTEIESWSVEEDFL